VIPLVSVILPVYEPNPAWLRAAVESALSQDGVSLEVILVDDGSRRQPAEPIVADLGVRLFTTPRNEGIAAARNRAAELAEGAWLAFLDQDDLWDAGKLGIQLAAAVGNDLEVLYSNAREIDADGRITCHRMDWPAPVTGLLDLCSVNRVPQLTAVVRREAYWAVGGQNEENRLCTCDYEMWLALAATGRPFWYDGRVLGSYRRHAGQDTKDDFRGRCGTYYALWQTFRKYPAAFGPAETAALQSRLANLAAIK